MNRILATLIFTIVFTSQLHAEPIFNTVLLKSAYMKYNSEVLVFEFENPISGGCITSAIAESNPASANNNELISFTLAALMAGKSIDVAFGGGCQNGNNWIQTAKIRK